MKKNIVTIAIGIMVLLLVTAVVVIITSEDKTGPEITFNIPDGQQITYTSGQDKQALIKYVKAVDSKDGDVSDSIMIEEIYVASDLTTANVVYVARDKNKNITKVSKAVKYLASKEEIDGLTKSNEKATGESNQSATTSATVATTKAEENATTASTKPVLTLSKNETTISQGGDFIAASVIKEITDDKDDKDTLFRRIIVGDYNTRAVGDYTFNISCTDTEGNTSNVEVFTLHVQATKQEVITTNQSEQTSDESEQTSDESEQTPDQSEQTSDESEQTSDESEQTPDQSEQTPEPTTPEPPTPAPPTTEPPTPAPPTPEPTPEPPTPAAE